LEPVFLGGNINWLNIFGKLLNELSPYNCVN
jgi:hypothetical protein